MTQGSSPEKTAESAKPVRCVVIQLARMGDTLQSLMALRAAKQLYPQLAITYVTRERATGASPDTLCPADAARRVPWIDEVIALPTDAVAGLKEEQALREAARWMIPLVRQPWDFVVNWSYSEASSFLTGLLPARVKLGYSRRKDLTMLSADGWSHFIQAVVQAGGALSQNIHLTDILTTQLLTALQIHVGEPAADAGSAVTSKSFFTLQLGERDLGVLSRESSRKWMAIQLGSARRVRSWSPAQWADYIGLVLRKNADYSIVLLGSASRADREREREMMALLQDQEADLKRVVSLVGQTDFDLWASVVSRAHWLLSGDTAAIHLASVLGTRVMNIATGGVRWGETGPYGNGHYVLSASEPCAACDATTGADETGATPHACQDRITPEAAYAVWSYGSTEWVHRRSFTLESHFAKLGCGADLPGIRVFRGRIRDTEAGGGLVYEPVLQRSMEYGEWTAMALGHIARSWYCGWVPPVGAELARERMSPALVKRLRTLDEATKVLAKIYGEACLTSLTLKKKSERLRSDRIMGIQDRQEVRELAHKLYELDELIERMGRTETPLLAFARMSKVLMHNLHGDHLADLGQESAECYRQLTEGLSILRDWVKHTLELTRPVALVSTNPPAKSDKPRNPDPGPSPF